MQDYRIHFKNIDAGKTSIAFTWDDNFTRHLELIAPEFEKRRLRCTFYINPGKTGFEKEHLPVCRELLAHGHELGSHSFQHLNYTEMPMIKCRSQVKRSIKQIKDKLGVYPATFAFPYHKYNEKHLNLVRQYHIETRNTLGNSKRFDIITSSTLQAMCAEVDEAIACKRSLVFAGHSAVLDLAEIEDKNIITGYEPILLDNLRKLLDYILSLGDRAEVLTFEQAALKEYVMSNARIEGDEFLLNAEQMKRLKGFGINEERLKQLL